MKIPFLLLFITLIFFISCDQQKTIEPQLPKSTVVVDSTRKINKIEKNEGIFSSLDHKTLLQRLFDNPEFDSTTMMAIWTPNYYERRTFPVSYDGYCYTKIDTILYFSDSQKRKCAAAILATYRYGRDDMNGTIDIGDCHFCGVPIGIALLSATSEKGWELYEFSKAFTSLGYFGNYKTNREDAGKIQLKTMGDPWTCLSLVQGIGGNMGHFSGHENIYSIEQYQLGGFPNNTLSCIFSYTYHYEKLSSDDDSIEEEENSTMKILKKKNAYSDIALSSTKNGKTKTRYYTYSEEYDQYINK